VRLFREVDGQQRGLGEMEKGDFFGEMSILEGRPRTVSAQALEDSELVEINSTTFDKMIRGNIEIAIRMLRKLSIRLREAERKVAELHPSALRAVAAARQTASGSTAAGKVSEGARLELAPGGQAFALAAAEVLIGRYDPVTEQRPDIDLTELDLKRSVSRRHARIVADGSSYTVREEVGALNGTFVNGTPLVAGQAHPLADGDRLSVGTVTLVFRA
jgi:CRP-like cAMP-binding protein